VVNFDLLTYAGNLANLEDCEKNPRYFFIKGDITDRTAVAKALEGCEVLINFAAESHVDRSIHDPDVFVKTNVLGTQVLLDEARKQGLQRFLQVSTDEVYGSLGREGLFTEQSPLQPNSPYSASKTAADCLVRAVWHTFAFPTLITRCSNNYGPYQFPEKMIPLFTSNILEGKKVPLYGDGQNVRDWIHVDDHNRAILAVLEKGNPGEVYNIGGGNEKSNKEITLKILSLLGKDEGLIEYVTDRPGHDRRYAIDASKIKQELSWKPRIDFDEGLEATLSWYRNNRSWWEDIKSGAYLDYYQKQYGVSLKK
jgi:dTDP-glucose 4,6-dehydratase